MWIGGYRPIPFQSLDPPLSIHLYVSIPFTYAFLHFIYNDHSDLYPILEFSDTVKILFRFPVNKELRKKWIKNLHRKNWSPKAGDRVCGKHFKESCFKSTGKKNTLKADAVPTIFVNSSNLHRPLGKRRYTRRSQYDRRLCPKRLGEDSLHTGTAEESFQTSNSKSEDDNTSSYSCQS